MEMSEFAQSVTDQDDSDEDKTQCGSCQNKEFIDSDNDEFSKRFKSLRIDSWRNSIQDLLDGKEDTFLLRAEEHTAQIGDKLDDSDLYSPARTTRTTIPRFART